VVIAMRDVFVDSNPDIVVSPRRTRQPEAGSEIRSAGDRHRGCRGIRLAPNAAEPAFRLS
jgi:hypothetical protein